MRRLKFLCSMVYTIILIYLIYRAYHAWQTNLIVVYLAIISLWTTGVWALSRIIDWLFHENTKLEQEVCKAEENESMQTKKLFENDINALLNELDKRKAKIPTLCNGIDLFRITVVPLNKRVFNDNLSKLGLINSKTYESLSEFYNVIEQVNIGYDKFNCKNPTEQKEFAEDLLKAINNGIKKGQKALQYLNE